MFLVLHPETGITCVAFRGTYATNFFETSGALFGAEYKFAKETFNKW
jgi:hypothetical protein